MKEPYFVLPEDEQKRLNRSEMQAIRWSLAAVNSCAYAKDDLAQRLQMIPDGVNRWATMLEMLRGLLNDLIGTVPTKQCLNIKHTLDDMELRMVPKFTPKDGRVCMGIDDLSYIVKEAKRDICIGCVYTGDECRQCKLYNILEAIAPCEDWGGSYICPYSKEDWWQK